MKILCERIMLTCINIFCPPLMVMLIAGVGPDCVINTCLFLAGVLPGHIHGFYISCTYLSRKRKVRKGKWPGGRKAFIYSERVTNGGTTNARAGELWEKREEERIMKEVGRMERRGSRRVVDVNGSGRGSEMGRKTSRRVDGAENGVLRGEIERKKSRRERGSVRY